MCYYSITFYAVVEQYTCTTQVFIQYFTMKLMKYISELSPIKNGSFHVEFLYFQYLHFHCSHCEAHHLHNCKSSKGLSHNYKQCNQFSNKSGIVLFIEDMKHIEPLAQPDTFLTVIAPLSLFSSNQYEDHPNFSLTLRAIFKFNCVNAFKCVEGC